MLCELWNPNPVMSLEAVEGDFGSVEPFYISLMDTRSTWWEQSAKFGVSDRLNSGMLCCFRKSPLHSLIGRTLMRLIITWCSSYSSHRYVADSRPHSSLCGHLRCRSLLCCAFVLSPDKAVICYDPHDHYDRMYVSAIFIVDQASGNTRARLGPVFIIWYGCVV